MSIKDYKRLFKVSLLIVTWFVFFLGPYLLSYGYGSHKYICSLECQGSAYLIKTENCIIPKFDLDNPSIKKFRRRVSLPRKELICSMIEPLTEVSGLNLIFFKDRLPSYESSEKTVTCYYQGIRRIEQTPDNYNSSCDSTYEFKQKILINSTKTRIYEDSIIVTCEDIEKNESIYKDLYYFVQPSKVQNKIERFKNDTKKEGKRPEKLNVIIMGTDSVSRLNLERHMPKTFSYLKGKLGAIDFKGFNKIGDNTHPNTMAMLADLTHSDMEEMQDPKPWSDVKADDYNFLWKNFSENGYVTVFTEDAPKLGTFTYEKVGFVKEPTDYYTRPYFQASESIIGHKGNGRLRMALPCQGSRWSIKIIHQLSLDIAKNLKDVPHFGLYWTSSLTHDYLDLAAIADKPSVDYLKKLFEGDYLENSALFFLSDHGIRFGDIRKTYAGHVEERMPYVMIRLPPWFRDTYPDAYNNMVINSERLTSTFDIYVTLRDILQRNYVNLSKSAVPAKYGQSLFRVVPHNRSCRDAGIPAKYCACQDTKEADVRDIHLAEAAKTAISVLNKGLQSFPGCAQLTLDKVISGRVGIPRSDEDSTKFKVSVITTYRVMFSTKPGEAEMEAHLQYERGKYSLTGDVSRINMYGNQSHCIHNYYYDKYCYCKDLLT